MMVTNLKEMYAPRWQEKVLQNLDKGDLESYAKALLEAREIFTEAVKNSEIETTLFAEIFTMDENSLDEANKVADACERTLTQGLKPRWLTLKRVDEAFQTYELALKILNAIRRFEEKDYWIVVDRQLELYQWKKMTAPSLKNLGTGGSNEKP
ncbi:MAG: hypothetical protein LBQ97_01120 [Fusobacteriaceae bacterium]|nr:hypothetical protein [Fusobacteriaceae bacterium]